jgi:hypothetical protein
MRNLIILITSLVCGSSLATLAPMCGLPVLVMAAIGIIIVCTHYCHPHGFLLMCLLNGVVIGMCLVCTFWHGGLAQLQPQSEGAFVAISCVTCIVLTCIILHFYTRGYEVHERVLNPVLGSMLLSMGISGLVPKLGAMKFAELMAPFPSTYSVGAWKFLGLWAALCCVSLPLQYWMMKDALNPKQKMKNFDELASRLVHPEASTTQEDVAKKLEDGAIGGRHLILCDAFYAPEDADMSHLTEHEKQLVAICRKDEFERDRIMFLGGLA